MTRRGGRLPVVERAPAQIIMGEHRFLALASARPSGAWPFGDQQRTAAADIGGLYCSRDVGDPAGGHVRIFHGELPHAPIHHPYELPLPENQPAHIRFLDPRRAGAPRSRWASSNADFIHCRPRPDARRAPSWSSGSGSPAGAVPRALALAHRCPARDDAHPGRAVSQAAELACPGRLHRPRRGRPRGAAAGRGGVIAIPVVPNQHACSASPRKSACRLMIGVVDLAAEGEPAPVPSPSPVLTARESHSRQPRSSSLRASRRSTPATPTARWSPRSTPQALRCSCGGLVLPGWCFSGAAHFTPTGRHGVNFAALPPRLAPLHGGTKRPGQHGGSVPPPPSSAVAKRPTIRSMSYSASCRGSRAVRGSGGE